MPSRTDTINVPVRREPLSIEEQGAGFHAVLAGTTGRVLITNDVGRDVLNLCDGSRTEVAITDALAATYPDVPRDRIATDVHGFLASATDKGAIEWTS
jgi:Coenzyme PQQ synthesis protein D (PqqD)